MDLHDIEHAHKIIQHRAPRVCRSQVNRMNIVIKGANFVNKGAEAMARTVQRELARRLPDSNFFMWRPHPWDCRPALNSGFNLLQLPFERKLALHLRPGGHQIHLFLWELNELFRSCNIKYLPSFFVSRQRLTNACLCYLNRSKMHFDCFIDISGFAYGDTWGLGNFKNIAPLMNYFCTKDKPVVFLPQAWGSFDKPHIRKSLREILKDRNSTFYSRDERSSRYLEQALDHPPGSLPSYPDIAFRFHGGSPEQGEHVLRSMGCTLSRPIIGIAPNMRVYERVSGKGMQNVYLKALVRLVNYCLEHYDIDIILQANEIAYLNNRMDDRYLCSLILASLSDPNRCFMTHDHLTAEATKSLIGHFDYLIASRFHSLVFGLSQGIPAMALSWSHKYRELFSMFGMEDRVHECQSIEPETLIETFKRGWAERKREHESIVQKANQIQAQVATLFDEVSEKIRGVRQRGNT